MMCIIKFVRHHCNRATAAIAINVFCFCLPAIIGIISVPIFIFDPVSILSIEFWVKIGIDLSSIPLKSILGIMAPSVISRFFPSLIPAKFIFGIDIGAVSYTHLTLPTILLV